VPGVYDYSEEDLDEKSEEIFILAPGEAPAIKEYDYGELSLDNVEDLLDAYSYDTEVEGLDQEMSEKNGKGKKKKEPEDDPEVFKSNPVATDLTGRTNRVNKATEVSAA
jgi:hypothetical protein